MSTKGEADRDDRGQEELDRAYDELEEQTPDRIARAIRWLREPTGRWVRIPLGILLVIASFGWFLPVLGLEFLPAGLLLLAQDLPFLRKPVARMTLWLEMKWVQLRCWWHRRKRKR